MRRTPGKTKQEREGYWIGVIHEARNYSGGVTAYCLENNISKHSYYWWFDRLRGANPAWQRALPSVPERRRKERAPSHVVTSETLDHEPRKRRKFAAAYKAHILRETEEALYGQQTALLKREGLNASHLQKWKKQRDTSGLEPKKRGRKTNPYLAETKRLQRQNAKLAKELEQSNAVIELQKKMAKLFPMTRNESGARELLQR